jgi:uncharacterized protein (DUF983 family)
MDAHQTHHDVQKRTLDDEPLLVVVVVVVVVIVVVVVVVHVTAPVADRHEYEQAP